MNYSRKRLLTVMLAFLLLVGVQTLTLGQVIRTAGEETGL